MGMATPRCHHGAVERDALVDDFLCRQHVAECTERRVVEAQGNYVRPPALKPEAIGLVAQGLVGSGLVLTLGEGQAPRTQQIVEQHVA